MTEAQLQLPEVNTTRLYEGMFLVDASLAASNWDEVEAALDTIFQRAGAEVVSLRKWDEHRLAYEIKGHKRAAYVLTYFRAPSSAVAGMERDVQLSEVVIRVLVLRVEHLEKDQAKLDDAISALTPAMMAEQEEQAEAEAAAAAAAEAAAPAAEAAPVDAPAEDVADSAPAEEAAAPEAPADEAPADEEPKPE